MVQKQEGLHLNIDHVVIEFLRDDGTVAKPGEEANIVVTELINHGMPLISDTVLATWVYRVIENVRAAEGYP